MPRRLTLPAQIVLALGLGVASGIVFGARAAALGEVALFFVKLLKIVATPLVFFAVVDTFVGTRLPLARALVMLPLSVLNALVAAAIALGLAHALPLGRMVDLPALRAIADLPTPPPHPIVTTISNALDRLMVGNVLYVIAAALIVGVALRLGEKTAAAQRLGTFAHAGFVVLMRVLGVVVHGVPIAAFGIVAKVVGQSGLAIFPVLGVFVIIVTVGLSLQVFAWYSVLLVVLARRKPSDFFRAAAEALGTALTLGSSMATLPVTLPTLEDKLGVSRESARLAAVVGTNLNHDGIILYEAAAALFVAQLYGVPLTLMHEVKIVGLSVLAAIGIAGVPEAGLVTLSLVIGRAGLPLTAVPLLLPVDWLLGRLRAMTNAASDMTVATVIDRFAAPTDQKRKSTSTPSSTRTSDDDASIGSGL